MVDNDDDNITCIFLIPLGTNEKHSTSKVVAMSTHKFFPVSETSRFSSLRNDVIVEALLLPPRKTQNIWSKDPSGALIQRSIINYGLPSSAVLLYNMVESSIVRENLNITSIIFFTKPVLVPPNL